MAEEPWIRELQKTRQALDDAIDRLTRDVSANSLSLQKLKKRKLRLKDEIEQLDPPSSLRAAAPSGPQSNEQRAFGPEELAVGRLLEQTSEWAEILRSVDQAQFVHSVLLDLEIDPLIFRFDQSPLDTVRSLVRLATTHDKRERLTMIFEELKTARAAVARIQEELRLIEDDDQSNDQIPDEEFWALVKDSVAQIRADRLDTREAHTAYIRERISRVFNDVRS
jgi:hypothetical protein